jgi:hypothetical protein
VFYVLFHHSPVGNEVNTGASPGRLAQAVKLLAVIHEMSVYLIVYCHYTHLYFPFSHSCMLQHYFKTLSIRVHSCPF